MANKSKRFLMLLLISLSVACSLFAQPTNVAYLIPKGFTGGVIVLYNQPDGIVPETSKDGTIIYRIPKDGFVKVKSPLDDKAHRFKYYFVDEKDDRTEIEYVYPEAYVRNPGDTTSKSLDTLSEEEQINQIFAMNHVITSFKIRGKQVHIYNFIVGKPKDIDNIYNKTLDRIDELEKEL